MANPLSYGQVLNGISNGVAGLSGLAGKIGNIISGEESSPAHVRDITTDGFLSSQPINDPLYFSRIFDEPTYLSFRIEFLMHDPVRNGALGNMEWDKNRPFDLGESLAYNYLYDDMPEPLFQDSKIIMGSDSEGNSKSIGATYSTMYYLECMRGDPGRALALFRLRNMLMDIQENYPYYFNSIEGLSSLAKISPNQGSRLKDANLTIKCYEGLDLKITQMKQLIRKIYWDDEFQRWALPDMMRYFGMRIYVSEIRLFHDARSTLHINKPHTYMDQRPEKAGFLDMNMTEVPQSLMSRISAMTDQILDGATALSGRLFGDGVTSVIGGINDTFATASDIMSSIAQAYSIMCLSTLNRVMPTICFDCHMCEFDISDSFAEIDNLKSHTGDEPLSQSIKIKVGNVHEYQMYPLDKSLRVSEYGYDIDPRTYVESENGDIINNAEHRFAGTNLIADLAFDKPINSYNMFSHNGLMADASGNVYDAIFDPSTMTIKQNTVDMDAIMHGMDMEYETNLLNEFSRIGFILEHRTDGQLTSHDNPDIYAYEQLLRGGMFNEILKNAFDVKGKNTLRYKRNYTDNFTSIMALVTSGVNLVSDNFIHKFSKATSVTKEELEEALPDIYASATALKESYDEIGKVISKATFDGALDAEDREHKLYDMRLKESVYASFLSTIATRSATKNKTLGLMAKNILKNTYNINVESATDPRGAEWYEAVYDSSATPISQATSYART